MEEDDISLLSQFNQKLDVLIVSLFVPCPPLFSHKRISDKNAHNNFIFNFNNASRQRDQLRKKRTSGPGISSIGDDAEEE